ncbi:Aconitase [Pleurostoma richardsiae]|uniref:Aconitase n=1 Tax=Pleurostoma richardsiae TaxID=41990 RepID=A0AA38RG59_9PEZI|nr:Aconitase [Pleurostoma richardsiae]
MHDVSHKGWVKRGDVIQVDIDWVLASELSWAGMEGVYDAVGRPGIFRNDRFWLAGDHRVEPELYDKPMVKELMQKSQRARDEFKLVEFQGFNYTILHTEFVRSRALPGQLCIGADSHSCSAGAVSCLSIGMGGADVCIPLITGQSWFTVPETVQFRLVGKPPKGVGGKDTILYILGKFKRNTVAADRVAEFTGPGIAHLSCDARFAIANMCTEFGAVSGIFESDQRTLDFIDRRRTRKHRTGAVYFKPDADAEYAETIEIDLSKVESFVAVHPSPDNVVPVDEMAGTKLDGTFIGACTTAEEDLIIGAMVLDAGLRQGQGVDKAAPGETWLSSQNRNFHNRMGPGSLANLASAATVAASSFEMRITNPRQLLDAINYDRLQEYLGYLPFEVNEAEGKGTLQYFEPFGVDSEDGSHHTDETGLQQEKSENNRKKLEGAPEQTVKGRAMRLGDFIDTDAIAPSKFLASCTTNESLGPHCMEFFMPEFREEVLRGNNIVVAGIGFGCGSSREVAVNALLGAGVQCVIAKSFAFIYARNQPNIGLLGITIKDDKFFDLAQTGADIEVDMAKSEHRSSTMADIETIEI